MKQCAWAFDLKFLTAVFGLCFSPVFVYQVRPLGYFALCGGRPKGAALWKPATFEKAAKAFNTGLVVPPLSLCAPFYSSEKIFKKLLTNWVSQGKLIIVKGVSTN